MVSCGEYIRQTVWPTGLAPFYSHPHMIPNGWTNDFYVRFAVYSLLLLVITAAAIAIAWWRPFLAVGWLWYLGTLVPVIGIIQVGTQARADRYTYLPMIGVYLMIAWLLMEIANRWPQVRASLASFCVIALAALSVATFFQVSYWVDSYKLFKHAKDVTERNYFAYNHIGIAYDSDAKKIGNFVGKEADDLFDYVSKYFDGVPEHLDDSLKPLLFGGAPADYAAKAKWISDHWWDETDGSARQFVERARRLTPVQRQMLLFDYSADAFQETIIIKPDYDFGNNNLGVFYARRGGKEDLKLAEERFRGALMSNQRYADAFNNLAIVLARQGKYDEAIYFHKMGLSVRNDRASDHNNLCRVYMQKNDLDNALQENNIALQCDPNFLGAWMSRAEILLKQGGPEEPGPSIVPLTPQFSASQCVERMMKIDPRAPETVQAAFIIATKHLNLSESAKQPEEAAKHLDKAILWLSRILEGMEINKSAAEVLYFRGVAYLRKGDVVRAMKDFEQVKRLLPEHPEIDKRIDEIRRLLPTLRK